MTTGEQCPRCGSYAINPHLHGRDGKDLDICDVCYWRKRAEAKDDPELDCTDGAHPAYWRGNDDGVNGAVMRIKDALSGKDQGYGVIGHDGLEEARRQIIKMRNECLSKGK